MTEEWKPVYGYLGLYEVSSLGRVRSLPHKTIRGMRGGKILKPATLPSGYLIVVLSKVPNTKRKHAYVHTLVLETFVGSRPPGKEACHDPDGSRANCRLDNLRWGTRTENMRDKAAHGTQTRGEAHPAARLTEEEVRKMLALRQDTGMSCQSIGTLFSVTQSQVWNIVTGAQWKHLHKEGAPP